MNMNSQLEQFQLDDEMKSIGFRPYVEANVAIGFHADLTTLSIDVKPLTHEREEPEEEIWRVYLGDSRKQVMLEYNFQSFSEARHAAMCIAKAVAEINLFIPAGDES